MLKDFLSKSVALETQTLMDSGPKSITHALKPITRLFSLGAKPSGKVIWQKYVPNVHLKSLSFDYSITLSRGKPEKAAMDKLGIIGSEKVM